VKLTERFTRVLFTPRCPKLLNLFSTHAANRGGMASRRLLPALEMAVARASRRQNEDNQSYYHEDRTHLGLAKDTPVGRPAAHHGSYQKIAPFSMAGSL
jgi:hypothetical protein